MHFWVQLSLKIWVGHVELILFVTEAFFNKLKNGPFNQADFLKPNDVTSFWEMAAVMLDFFVNCITSILFNDNLMSPTWYLLFFLVAEQSSTEFPFPQKTENLRIMKHR